MKRTRFDYIHVPDAGELIINEFKITTFPTHIIVDQENKISYYTSGYSPQTVGTREKRIAELLKK